MSIILSPSDFEFRIGEQEVDVPFLEFRTTQAHRIEKWEWLNERIARQFGEFLEVGHYVSVYLFKGTPTESNARGFCDRLVGAGFKRVW